MSTDMSENGFGAEKIAVSQLVLSVIRPISAGTSYGRRIVMSYMANFAEKPISLAFNIVKSERLGMYDSSIPTL